LAIDQTLSNNRFVPQAAKVAGRSDLGHRHDMSNDSAPDAGSLYQAALDYLARYAATQAGLRRILQRRIDRWAQAQADRDAAELVLRAARNAIDAVIGRLTEAGALSDAAFAESRARSLLQSGQSTRSVQMRLVAKGVAPAMARQAATTDADTELAAALVLARKRRIGPYRTADDDGPAVRTKEMGVLARAGFSRDISRKALDASREDAEARIFNLRR
jgi:regulatory protein